MNARQKGLLQDASSGGWRPDSAIDRAQQDQIQVTGETDSSEEEGDDSSQGERRRVAFPLVKADGTDTFDFSIEHQRNEKGQTETVG